MEPSAVSRLFAIVCMGRTGSQLLVRLLNSHPEIECKGELFGPHREYSEFPALTRREFLEQHAYDTDLPIKGFKMPFDWILDHPGIFDDFRHLGYRIVRLNRENVLAHLVSIKLAQRNNDWASRNRYSMETTSIKESELWEFAGSRSSCNTVLNRFSAPLETAYFSYEALLAPELQRRLLKFLGAPPVALTTDTVRQRTRPLSETIENIAELRRALSGTGLAAFLAE